MVKATTTTGVSFLILSDWLDLCYIFRVAVIDIHSLSKQGH